MLTWRSNGQVESRLRTQLVRLLAPLYDQSERCINDALQDDDIRYVLERIEQRLEHTTPPLPPQPTL